MAIPQYRVTIAEVAEQMGISRQVITYHCRHGHLRKTARLIKVGRTQQWTITVKAADKFAKTYTPWGRA